MKKSVKGIGLAGVKTAHTAETGQPAAFTPALERRYGAKK
jgi:hypothetical protein